MQQSDYLDKGVINNPLNIKRVNGDLPTTKGSPKNIVVLIIVGAILALTANQVWGIAYAIIGSTPFTVFFLGLIYGAIILTTMHFTVLEGPKNIKAYKDYLENKIKDLSVMWEIQDIKETEIDGIPVGYIDYIDSTRSIVIKCVPGAILNQESNKPLLHYNSLEKALNFLDELGFKWEIDSVGEASDESDILNYFYAQLKYYNDPEFVSIFTEMLDTIDLLTDMKSSVENIYIKIIAVGNLKHQMADKIMPVLDILRTNTSFRSANFLTKDEIDVLNAAENSVNNYDREELIMNKYKSTENLGITSVIEAYDKQGSLLRKFQEDFDPKKLVKKRSISLQQSAFQVERRPILKRVKLSGPQVVLPMASRPVMRTKLGGPTKVVNPSIQEGSKTVQPISLGRARPKSMPTSMKASTKLNSRAFQEIAAAAERLVEPTHEIGNQLVRDKKLLDLIYSDGKVKLGD